MELTTEEEQYIEDCIEAVDLYEEFVQIRGEFYWPYEIERVVQRFRLAKRLKIKP